MFTIFLLIVLQLIGESIVRVSGFPVPGAIIGLVLLYVILVLRGEIPDEIRKKKWGRLGVDTDGDFKPYYVIPNDKRKHVQALKAALKGATQVYLATDPDREGESISWHLK